jgi:hypothetical protein
MKRGWYSRDEISDVWLDPTGLLARNGNAKLGALFCALCQMHTLSAT